MILDRNGRIAFDKNRELSQASFIGFQSLRNVNRVHRDPQVAELVTKLNRMKSLLQEGRVVNPAQLDQAMGCIRGSFNDAKREHDQL